VVIAKDVRASHQIDKEEECRGDSKRRKNDGIDKCQHNSLGFFICLVERIMMALQNGRSPDDKFMKTPRQ